MLVDRCSATSQLYLFAFFEKLSDPVMGGCDGQLASHFLGLKQFPREPTAFEIEALGFNWPSESQRRSLVRALRQELARTRDRQQLLVFAHRWLYDHQLIIIHDRSLRSTVVSATRKYEADPIGQRGY